MQQPLSLEWSFGLKESIGVFDLNFEQDPSLFYVSGNTGVLYHQKSHTQTILQGHINEITSAVVSKDLKWIVTADAGIKNNSLIIWNAQSGIPYRTFFDPHQGNGVLSVDISPDGKYIASLGANFPQTVCLWEWSVKDEPLYQIESKANSLLLSTKFNPFDIQEICITGQEQVVFIRWDNQGIQEWLPIYNPVDFNLKNQQLIQTVFLSTKQWPKSYLSVKELSKLEESEHLLIPQAITSTSDGNLLVWSDRSLENLLEPLKPQGKKAAIKTVKLHNFAIHCLFVYDDAYIVTGSDDGNIKIYDFHFRLVYWVERTGLGPLRSISVRFGSEKLTGENESHQFRGFKCLLSTSSSKIFQLDTQSKEKSLILESSPGKVNDISGHPNSAQFATGGSTGILQIWDLTTKRVIQTRSFDKEINCLSFSYSGNLIALGFTNGIVKFIDSQTLQECSRPSMNQSNDPNIDKSATFPVSKASIEMIQFSQNEEYLATGDANSKISLFKLVQYKQEMEWDWIGNINVHHGPLVSLSFGIDPEENCARFFSLGKDRFLVEFDLVSSSIQEGIQIKNKTRIAHETFPTAMKWFRKGESIDHYLLFANNFNKLRSIHANTKSIRKTVLAPLSQYNIEQLIVQQIHGREDLIIFKAEEGVIGLIQGPLDGNPFHSFTMTGHARQVLSLSTCLNGGYIISVGIDGGIHAWKTDLEALDQQIAIGGNGYEPFVSMLPGGQYGAFYREMEDLFYYAQLKKKEKDSAVKEDLDDRVHIDQIPSLLQSLGSYLSEFDIENLMNEIKFDHALEQEELPITISFDDFIKLYVNHRSLRPVTGEDVALALSKVLELNEVSFDTQIDMTRLKQSLLQYGEVFTAEELKTTIEKLTEKHELVKSDKISIQDFITDVLGFVSVDQQEE